MEMAAPDLTLVGLMLKSQIRPVGVLCADGFFDWVIIGERNVAASKTEDGMGYTGIVNRRFVGS